MPVIHGGMRFKKAVMHRIRATVHGVQCNCGYSKPTTTYTEARKFAEKHAMANTPALIEPIINN